MTRASTHWHSISPALAIRSHSATSSRPSEFNNRKDLKYFLKTKIRIKLFITKVEEYLPLLFRMAKTPELMVMVEGMTNLTTSETTSGQNSN